MSFTVVRLDANRLVQLSNGFVNLASICEKNGKIVTAFSVVGLIWRTLL